MSEENTSKEAPLRSESGPLHPESGDAVSSMAQAFRNAMKGSQSEPVAEKPAPEPAEVLEESPEPQGADSKESRSAKDFKLIKQERDEWRAKFDELTSKYDSLEQSQASSEEFEKLKSEYEKMSETLSLTNLERHPKFQEQYTKPIQTQIDRAKAYVPEESRKALEKILAMPVSEARANALDDLVGDLPASRQAYLQGIVNKIDEISYDRDVALSESKEAYAKLVEEENLLSSQKSQERDKMLNKSFDSMLKKAQENISIYQLREGDEEWNNGVRERVTLAKKILMEQNSFEDAATAALWAASGGALVEQNAALVEHNRRLQTELSKLKGAEPNAAGTRVSSVRRPTKDSGGFTERVLGELSAFR